MRKPRRRAVAVAVSSLLVAGLATFATSQLAHADVAGTCAGVGADAFCNVSETITSPSSISVSISATPRNQYPGYYYTLECSLGSQSSTTTGSGIGLTMYTASIALPYAVPDSCNISVTADIETGNGLDSLSMTVNFTTGTPSSSSSGPVSLVRGYDNKCLDDKGNSSANRTPIMIWSCNSSDSAQGWTFSNGELKHNGECANVQGGAASGHKLILWSCNGASNEKWFHSSSNGEYVLSGSSSGLLCLDDPGYSKTNGTQLTVYACRNTSNEHWSS
jgi:ricin-type beta-trefoil lectin protein